MITVLFLSSLCEVSMEGIVPDMARGRVAVAIGDGEGDGGEGGVVVVVVRERAKYKWAWLGWIKLGIVTFALNHF